jgi:transcriptional regulator with XRE-family HTH domain
MPRRAINPSELTKWRLNQGIETSAIVEKTGLSQPTVYRIERGDAVARTKVGEYLKFWGGDLNNLKMFPEQLLVIDEGAAVRISFSRQNK